MVWPHDGDSHFYGDGSEVGAFPPASTATSIYKFKAMRDELETMGIKVWNLSPEKHTPFGRAFNHKAYAEFTEA